ncbi:hypothetical protein C3747_2g203 [Trypanosoma cruzi]|uniref:Uncharacterized protein n=2 Tax=Trypanosoma cruzi TaxID=5693 RepID=Q4D2X1_TRYCC|nr:hypothetical protein, conserved [Trypanosoma cruzi]EAN86872.1 hypothetical protein, conserved [Trypanosoma cruzi]PWV21612.1 hypothetical protein C3747_2g203 [Trypanosoma cruzi]RNC61605.1 hypothetical protein TcCL_ESM00684 [Trypanosoma cruzi]|eukprot:XP_808723.1 hypothetical protein [Trypanosoma cruzi strain CL Brener]
MTQKELALAAQFNGSYRCATTVVVRTAATETIHRAMPARTLSKQRGDSASRSGNGSEGTSTPQKGTRTNGSSPSTHNPSCERPRCTFWLARSDGDIEIRSVAVPDRVIDLVHRTKKAIVTSLLQISRNRVVAALSNGLLQVLDAVSLQECRTVQAHKSSITCMVPVTLAKTQRSQEEFGCSRIPAFVTASSDLTIAKWDGVTLECLGRMKGHSCSVTALAATVSGAFLFSGGEDGSLRMWSLAEGAQVLRKPTSQKNAKKGTKTKETAVTPSGQQPQQDTKKKRKQSLLPVQKEGSHTARHRAVAQVSTARATRSLSAQTPSRGGATKAVTTPRTPSVATRKKGSRAMSLVLEGRPPRKKSIKSSNSKPITPRPGPVHFSGEPEAAMNEEDADEEEEEEREENDDEEKDRVTGSEKTRALLPAEDETGASLRNGLNAGEAGEHKTPRKTSKVKKGKKRLGWNFDTVLKQLLGDSVEDPVVRHFFAMQHFCWEEDTALLWPMKCEHQKAITGLTLIRDRILVTASQDGVAKMFALPTGRMLRSVHRGRAALTGLVMDELHCRLWIGSADGSLAVYDVLHPDVVPLYSWRDLNTPHPQLVPLVFHGSLSHLYVFSSFDDKNALSLLPVKDENRGEPAHPCQGKKFFVKDSSHKKLCSDKKFNLPAKASLTCVWLDGGDGAMLMDIPFLKSLDKQFESTRSFFFGNSVRDAVFRRIIRRPVTEEGEELPQYLARERAKAASAVQFAFTQALRQRAFSRWLMWRARRMARYRCMRAVRFLEVFQQERVLESYFKRWQRWRPSARRLLLHMDMSSVEKRLKCISTSYRWNEICDVADIARELGNSFAAAEHRRLLQRYYRKWVIHIKETRRRNAQSTAFNRLFLSFCDVTFGDKSFIWKRLRDAAEATQRRRRALWLLEQHMVSSQHKCRRYYMKLWIKYVKRQKEVRHSLVLVDTLSSVLADERALRSRFYLKWYRFALFEARLLRLDEERTTMQREWIAVQNAVDSTASLTELRQEAEQLEVEIAEQAFERDEVESRNLALRSDIEYLQVQKSLECLLAGYRDSSDTVRRRRDSGSASRSKMSCNTSRERITLFADDDTFDGEVGTLRQVGAVLRALKATGVRCGRHRALIMASYERVVQLSILEYPLEACDYNSIMSLCSNSDESSLRMRPNALVTEGKTSSEQRRHVTAHANTPPFLSDEFDRTMQRLQSIIVNAARLTGVNLNEPSNYDSLISIQEESSGNEKRIMNTTDCASLRWLDFVPPTTRTEALPLIVDLVAMFDSLKAHSDMEVEGGEKKLSTRGAAKVIPLPLRSLCKPQTAVWLVRHAAVLLELMSPGLWKRHLKLRTLATGVTEPGTGTLSSDAAESSPARSAGATATSDNSPGTNKSRTYNNGALEGTPRQSIPQQFPRLSVDELGVCKKQHRSMSWTASETRRGHSQKVSSPCGRATFQQRVLVHSGGSLTPRPKSSFQFKEEDSDGPRRSLPIPLPFTHSSASTPTKSMYGSSTTRPYLGFRVAVSRDDAGHTTLTVHEVAESYVGASDGVTREGPAFASGLRAGDQLVRFAGYAVTELAAFNAVVARHVRPHGTVPVVFSRNGQLMSSTIAVGEKSRNG